MSSGKRQTPSETAPAQQGAGQPGAKQGAQGAAQKGDFLGQESERLTLAEQKKALTILRNQVVRELELHKRNIELTEAVHKLQKKEEELLRIEDRYRKIVELLREKLPSSDIPQ